MTYVYLLAAVSLREPLRQHTRLPVSAAAYRASVSSVTAPNWVRITAVRTIRSGGMVHTEGIVSNFRVDLHARVAGGMVRLKRRSSFRHKVTTAQKGFKAGDAQRLGFTIDILGDGCGKSQGCGSRIRGIQKERAHVACQMKMVRKS